MAESMFDVAVIGGGLIGSAAARHLAEAGARVVVLAPAEPTDWTASSGPFASHYDSGRITRIVDRDPVWAELGARSIARYDDIAARSGIDFHTPCGLAWIGADLAEATAISQSLGGDASPCDPAALYARTGLKSPDPELDCLFEGPPAGAIDPRKLAVAQLKLAAKAGAIVVASPATALIDHGEAGVEVRGDFTAVRAQRIVIASGAYGASLIGRQLDLTLWLRTTVRIDIGAAPGLPCAIVREVENKNLISVYFVPPVTYPDGAQLFKIGGTPVAGRQATTTSDIAPWFAGIGAPTMTAALLDTAQALLPATRFRSYDAKPCVMAEPSSGYPYVGFIDERIIVACGGNGSSAKSSDELGRLAAVTVRRGEEPTADNDRILALLTPRLAD